ncbi:L,D-transpeptidase [Bacteroidia bacterium]|nr:L,D-transpeptidase [Bacteroidia bacterium]
MKSRRSFALICILLTANWSPVTGNWFPATAQQLNKALTYKKYTLDDTYNYKSHAREFQWDKIKASLAEVDQFYLVIGESWGILKNKSNGHGEPPLPRNSKRNEYRTITDSYGKERDQAIPLYLPNDLKVPDRYGSDGSLVKIIGEQEGFTIAKMFDMDEIYRIPSKYVYQMSKDTGFEKVVVVDRKNQNISTYEKVNADWVVRSMNPCTTGAHRPPYQHPTPLGLFVIQNKVKVMPFCKDGTREIGGWAPWASRFSEGAYLHGVPVSASDSTLHLASEKNIVEFRSSLGTMPLSHACVRNASSHAKFIYDKFPSEETLVFVIE